MDHPSEIRLSLHKWIDKVPEQDLPLLRSVMEAERGEKPAYTKAQMDELLERRAAYLAGKGKKYSPTEAIQLKDDELTSFCMQISERSLSKVWEQEDDEYWASYLKD